MLSIVSVSLRREERLHLEAKALMTTYMGWENSYNTKQSQKVPIHQSRTKAVHQVSRQCLKLRNFLL